MPKGTWLRGEREHLNKRRLWMFPLRFPAHVRGFPGWTSKEAALHSDFSAARLHLDRACDYLRGDDETSCKAREALDLLIEAITTAEYARPCGEVLRFPEKAQRGRR